MAENIALLFPYRDTNNRLMFRGCVGDNSDVTLFYPYREAATGRMMLRGADSDGKIIKGFPYRDSSGKLMGRILALTGSGGIPPFPGNTCWECPGSNLPSYMQIELSNCPVVADCHGMSMDFSSLNGFHTLPYDTIGSYYSDCSWRKYIGVLPEYSIPYAHITLWLQNSRWIAYVISVLAGQPFPLWRAEWELLRDHDDCSYEDIELIDYDGGHCCYYPEYCQGGNFRIVGGTGAPPE